jgi:toxin ParE1/3/4
MARVVRTAQAEADIVDILVYLRKRDPKAADRFEAEFEGKCHMLAQFPLAGRSREELAPSLRSGVVSPYLVFYLPLDDGIEVIRVLHGSRDLPSALE